MTGALSSEFATHAPLVRWKATSMNASATFEIEEISRDWCGRAHATAAVRVARQCLQYSRSQGERSGCRENGMQSPPSLEQCRAFRELTPHGDFSFDASEI